MSIVSCSKSNTIVYDDNGNPIDSESGEILFLDDDLKPSDTKLDKNRVFYEIFVGFGIT